MIWRKPLLFSTFLVLTGCAEPTANAQEPPSLPSSVAGPDLTVSEVSVEPAETFPGGGVTVDARLENIGSVESDDVQIGYYLSVDHALDDSDTLLNDDQISDLEPGESEPESETLTLPADLSPGDYYLLVFVDATQILNEVREDNNVLGAGVRVGSQTASRSYPQPRGSAFRKGYGAGAR